MLKVTTACERCVCTARLVDSVYVYYRTCGSGIKAPLGYFKVGEGWARGGLQPMWRYMGSYVWSHLSLTKAFEHVMCAAVVRVEALRAVKWLRRKWRRVSARLWLRHRTVQKRADIFLKNGRFSLFFPRNIQFFKKHFKVTVTATCSFFLFYIIPRPEAVINSGGMTTPH